jgi:hypothetical protein
MVRSLWIGPVLTVLAVTGLAWSQVLPSGATPAAPKEHTMTVQETDKPPLKCKILKMWHEADGGRAFQVQALSTGEMLTIVQPGSTSSEPGKAATMKIVHWGDNTSPPSGTPLAPAGATIMGTPGPVVEVVKQHFPPRTAADMPKSAATGRQWPSAYAPEDTTPDKEAATTVIAQRPAHDDKPSAPDKKLPATLASEEAGTKPAALPIQMSGVDLKKTDGGAATTTPGMPVQVKGNDPKPPKVVVPAPAVIPPVVAPGPKPIMTEIVRADEAKVSPPVAVTTVPAVNASGTSLGNKEKVIVQAPPKAVSAAVKSPYAAVPPAVDLGPGIDQTPASKNAANADAVKSNDWRKSWGRVEPLPPDAVVKPEAPRNAAKADGTHKSDAPSKLDLPHADSKKPDPLAQPDRYTKLPLPADAGTKPVQQAKSSTDPKASATKPPVTAPDLTKTDKGTTTVKTPATAQADLSKNDRGSGLVKPPFTPGAEVSKPAEPAKPYIPPGMGSIAAAQVAEQSVMPPADKAHPAARPQANAYDSGNAFSPPQPRPTTPNQGSPAMAQVNYTPSNPMMPPMPPQVPPRAVQIQMDRGVPSGMGNAFTNAGTARPIPPDFGQPNQAGNAFSPPSAPTMPKQMATEPTPANPQGPTMTAMADPRALPSPLPAVANATPPAPSNTPQLVAVLRDSLYPSQREWAVESLSSQRSSQSNPQVVQALISAAKEDPAATVRAGCVRAIAQLQIKTMPAMTAVQSLKCDPDPRVRREAEQALPMLTGGQPLPLDTSVRPVSGN